MPLPLNRMISIIIVEDNYNKLGKITSLLDNELDIPASNVTTASNVKEAKIQMRSTTFDLMILDLVLPLDSDDEVSPENGISFLNTIQTNPTINPPIHIVGLTSFP
jgi:CheY-like chemotaxis protein